eukprot:4930180-Amphidinium_carterae.1
MMEPIPPKNIELFCVVGLSAPFLVSVQNLRKGRCMRAQTLHVDGKLSSARSSDCTYATIQRQVKKHSPNIIFANIRKEQTST